MLADIQQRVGSVLRKRSKKKGKPSTLPDKVQKGANVVVVRISCPSDCAVDAVLRQQSDETFEMPAVDHDHVSTWLQAGSDTFWRKFGRVFGDLGNFSDKDKKAAAAALSNAIGVRTCTYTYSSMLSCPVVDFQRRLCCVMAGDGLLPRPFASGGGRW